LPEPGISRAASIFADRYACLDGCALRVLWCRKRKTGHYSTAASADLQHLGTVTPLAGGSGATVTLAGATSATQAADSSGNYTFTGLPSGAYTVTPSHIGYTFSPNSLAATINGAMLQE